MLLQEMAQKIRTRMQRERLRSTEHEGTEAIELVLQRRPQISQGSIIEVAAARKQRHHGQKVMAMAGQRKFELVVAIAWSG